MTMTPEERLDALEEALNSLTAQISGKANRVETSIDVLALEDKVGAFRLRIDTMRDQLIAISTRLRQATSSLAP